MDRTTTRNRGLRDYIRNEARKEDRMTGGFNDWETFVAGGKPSDLVHIRK